VLAVGPLLVCHCDWSGDPRKQWAAIGRIDASGDVRLGTAQLVGNATELIGRLVARAAGAPVLVGFDFPIGLPAAFAERAGVTSFPSFARAAAQEEWPQFFELANAPEEISVRRPFYPRQSAGTRRQHLTDALGVQSFDDLYRWCERSTDGRAAASPLFWLVGAKQVGRAAISGWRDVVIPAVLDHDARLWPFDGPLPALLEGGGVVLAETYPAEFYGHLGARPGPGGKTSQAGRAPACAALVAEAGRLGATLTKQAEEDLFDAFGGRSDGEDRFDAFVGLLGMVNVLLGHRPAGPPASVPAEVVAVEGWMLGQEAGAPLPLQREEPQDRLWALASLLRRRNSVDAEIARLIGRPALQGHIGEFIAAEVFDIELHTSATNTGHDGVFRSGPLAGRTVDVKWYARREGILDLPRHPADHLLVLTGAAGPAGSSAGTHRPLVVEEVFLFDVEALVARLRERGVAQGIATSVRLEEWERARVWPAPGSGAPLELDAAQRARLRRLGQGTDVTGA
jgi:hypothetical protein